MLFSHSFFLLGLSPALASAALVPKWTKGHNRQGAIKCGVKGHADTDNNIYWSASKKLASYAACSALCARDQDCQSFGYSSKACMLFDEPLSGNFETDQDSIVTYYDAACDGPATSTGFVSVTRTSTTATQTAGSVSQTTVAAIPTVTIAATTETSMVPTVTVTGSGASQTSSTADNEDDGGDEDGEDDEDDGDESSTTSSAISTTVATPSVTGSGAVKPTATASATSSQTPASSNGTTSVGDSSASNSTSIVAPSSGNGTASAASNSTASGLSGNGTYSLANLLARRRRGSVVV